jgi:Sulfatase-modifying factor enzyme 1
MTNPSSQQAKYDLLKPPGRRLARIPRFGRLIAMMSPEQFSRLTSEAATFWELYSYVDFHNAETTGLIDSGLNTAGAKLLGWLDVNPPEPKPDRELPAIRLWQRDLAMGLLGAIAFEMTCGVDGTGQSDPIYVVEGDLRAFLERAFTRFWKSGAYIDECGDPILSKRNLWNEWKRLKQMNSQGLQYVLLSDCGSDNLRITSPGEKILFADISTQEFFAAYWAANWSTPDDCEMMIRWLPSFDNDSAYSEFWETLLDLPDIAIDCFKWQMILAPVYYERVGARLTEFIYRTWDRMDGSDAKHCFETEGRNYGCVAAWDTIALCEGHLANDTGVFPTTRCSWKPFSAKQLMPFRIFRHCVTNCEYERFDPSHEEFREFRYYPDDHPVVNVTWFDAWCFCKWLGTVELDGKLYRFVLPTEIQWEYSCRAGTSTDFCFGDLLYDEIPPRVTTNCGITVIQGGGRHPVALQLDAYAWYNENSKWETHPVGENSQMRGACLTCMGMSRSGAIAGIGTTGRTLNAFCVVAAGRVGCKNAHLFHATVKTPTILTTKSDFAWRLRRSSETIANELSYQGKKLMQF